MPLETKHPKPETLFSTVKELAAALGRSEDYVTYMKAGGFQLPATLAEAVAWIREHPHPTRYRLHKHAHRPTCTKKT